MPSLSLCYSLDSLLNSSSRYYFDDDGVYQFPYLNKTADELFRMTPPANDSLESCSFRNLHYNTLILVSSSVKCGEYFIMDKYRLHGSMCYRYRRKEKHQFNFFDVTYSINAPQVLFSLSMKSPLDSGSKLRPIVHYRQDAMRDSNFVEETILPTDQVVSFDVTFEAIIVLRLPAPYDTMCTEDSSIECYMDCVDQVFARYGLSRQSGITFSNQSDLIIPDEYTQYRGKKLKDIIDEVTDICPICGGAKCYDYLVKTYLSQPRENLRTNSLTFIVKTIANPPLKMKAVAVMNLTDFLTEITSWSSIWLSFSFFGILHLLSHRSDSKASKRLKIIKKKVKDVHLRYRLLNYNLINQRIRLCEDESARKKRIKKFINIAVQLVLRCLVLYAFMVQLLDVSMNYFAYESITRLDFEFDPIASEFPKLIVCVSFNEMFDSTEYPIVNTTNYYEIYTRKASKLNLTLAQMFNLSPDALDVMKGCRLRSSVFKRPEMLRYNFTECSKLFNTTQYYWSHYSCYQYELIGGEYFQDNNTDIYFFRQHSLKGQIAYPGILYSIILDESLVKYAKIDINLYQGDLRFDASESFVRIYPRQSNNILAFVGHHVLNQTLLPFPYDSNCDESETTSGLCFHNCLVEGAATLNRLPRNEIFSRTQMYDMRVMSFIDTQNTSFYQLWQDIRLHCRHKCSRADCHVESSVISLDVAHESKEKLEVTVNTFNQPIWYIKAEPVVYLYEVIYNILCSLSFWFGFSLISLNPAVLWMKIRKRKVKQKIQQKVSQMAHFINIVNRSLEFYVENSTPSLESLKSKIMSEVKKIRKKLFLVLLICPMFIIHCYLVISLYLTYPTIMFFHLKTETALDHELAVCLDLHELFDPSVGFNRNITPAVNFSSLFDIAVNEMFTQTPGRYDLLTACGFRGLKAASTIGHVTDTIFFVENDPARCRQIFKSEKYLIKHYVCYQFYPRDAPNESIESVDINSQENVLMIALDTNKLTTRVMVSVSMRNSRPFVSSVFSPSIVVQKDSYQWYAVSYIKYIQHTLPYYYSLDGFENIVYGRCWANCLNSGYGKLGYTYSAFHDSPTHLKFITPNDFKLGRISLPKLERVKDHCFTACQTSSLFEYTPEYHYISTRIIATGDQTFNRIDNSTAFYLRQTRYPVITLIFKVAISTVQLAITLGSILSIWFGLAMSLFYLKLQSYVKKISTDRLLYIHSHLGDISSKLKILANNDDCTFACLHCGRRLQLTSPTCTACR